MAIWLRYLIICPLVFLAGFVDSIAGGGGLISLPAYLLAGLAPHEAVGTNKVSSCLGTTVATVRYAREGYIPLRETLLAVPCALTGSYLGTQISLAISDDALRVVLLVVLPLTAVYVVFFSDFSGRKRKLLPQRTGALLWVAVVLISLVIGVYDGFYGPGTGTFLMLLLTGILHMAVENAAGLTKAINLSTNVMALAVYLVSGKAQLAYGLPAALFSMAGNYLGSRCFLKNGARVVRPVMLLVLGVFFVRTLLEVLGA